MINLVALDGEAFVWNADDWYELRKKHRICGSVIGTFGMLAHQDRLLSLPLALMPEETHFLLTEKIARLVEYEAFRQKPSGDLRQKFEEFRAQSYLDQVNYFQEERRKKITGMVDIIVEGKRRKLMGLATKKAKRRKLSLTSAIEVGPSTEEMVELPDRDSIIKNELNKVVPIPEEISLVQVPTECNFLRDLEVTDVSYPVPNKRIDLLKTRVFSDLWHRGFYVTAGQKFGGDFLAYAGDPMKFHAQYIVTCRLPEESFSPLSLISLCRVGAAVKKAILVATFEEDEESEEEQLRFETLNWLT